MNLLRPTHAPRLLAAFGTLTLLASVGLFASSRPAHTAGGAVAVNVANTPTVNVADSPARQPFQTEQDLSVNSGFGDVKIITVPAGKRLVVESLTVLSNYFKDSHSSSVVLASNDSLGNPTGQAGLSLTPDGTPYPIKTQPVRLTVEAGGSLTVQSNTSGGNGSDDLLVTASGYYVDVP